MSQSELNRRLAHSDASVLYLDGSTRPAPGGGSAVGGGDLAREETLRDTVSTTFAGPQPLSRVSARAAAAR